MKKRLTSLL
jgi:hypothetical protein